ncbi:24949_t:CDS:1, partial [Racocetra persica]
KQESDEQGGCEVAIARTDHERISSIQAKRTMSEANGSETQMACPLCVAYELEQERR